MNKNTFNVLALIAACVSAIHLPAQAQSQDASSVTGSLKMTAVLFDLDPTDGVSPQILNVQRNYGVVNLNVNQSAPYANLVGELSHLTSATQPESHITRRGDDWMIDSAITWGAGGAFDLAEVSLSAQVTPAKSLGLAYSLSDGADLKFDLSAHTALVVFADVSMGASVSGDSDYREVGNLAQMGYSVRLGSGKSVGAGAVIEGVSSYSYSSGSLDLATCRWNYQSGGCESSGKYSDVLSRKAYVSFVNDGADAMAGEFEVALWGAGSASVSPVPEPEALLLFAAGVGVAFGRRRLKS